MSRRRPSRRQFGASMMLRAATSISALTLLSRVLGLVRDVLTSHLLGTTWVNGVLQLAWMLPNMLRRLFGEGALSAAFVPAFTKQRELDGPGRARGLLASVIGVSILGLGALCLLVVVTSLVIPPALWHLEPAAGDDAAGPATAEEVGALMSQLLAILFPYALPICVLAILAGTLNALGVFAPAAAAPALLNVFGLAGLTWGYLHARDDLPQIARIVAWFLLVGGLFQLLLVAMPLARRKWLPAPRLPEAGDGSREVFRAMGPTLLGMSLVQLNVFVDQGLAAWLIGPGSNYHIFLANRLLLFPHALVALPLATAVFPSLAAHASRDDLVSLRSQLDRALAGTLFLAVPATVGLALLAAPLLDIAFVHGRYTDADAQITRWTTIALVIGLPALGASQLAARALYALGDTKTPARIAAWLVLVNLTLNLTFLLVLGMGVAGLTAATTCCTFVNAVALRRAVDRLAPGRDHPLSAIVRALLASGAMAGAILLLRSLLPDAGSRAQAVLLELAIPVTAGIVVYTLAQIALRSPELRMLGTAWRARRKR